MASTTGTGTAVTLLLPPLEALRGPPAPALDLLLARAGLAPALATGMPALLAGVVDTHPKQPAIAALTQLVDGGDTVDALWLRADPAYVRADLGAARLMACGALGLERAAADELARGLRPLFGDAGFELRTPHPERWYLRLPIGTSLPAFAPPDTVLGDDIGRHLPEGEAGRRWRHLLNEAQVLLHHHPVNAARVARGAVPVNSVWFWGGGARPDWVRSTLAALYSDDPVLVALARLAKVAVSPPAARADVAAMRGDTLIDLRAQRDVAPLEADWIAPLLAALRRGTPSTLALRFADGTQRIAQRSDLWKFWRRRGKR